MDTTIDRTNDLTRYMRVGRLLGWISSGEFKLSSPAHWHDEVERFWFRAAGTKLAIDEKQLMRQVFGACFTSEYYSEALWKRFGEHDDIVRVTIRRDELETSIQEWTRTSGAVHLLRDVHYDDVAILASKVRQCLKELRASQELTSDGSRAKLLTLWLSKTWAFQFEQECRVLVFMREPLAKGASPSMPLSPAIAVKRVMFYNKMDSSLRALVELHLKQKIPGVSIGSTVVNRVPKALERIVSGVD